MLPPCIDLSPPLPYQISKSHPHVLNTCGKPCFLEIQDVHNFYRPIAKTKVLNDSFNRFVYKFYPQSLLILEEYLSKWLNANFI